MTPFLFATSFAALWCALLLDFVNNAHLHPHS